MSTKNHQKFIYHQKYSICSLHSKCLILILVIIFVINPTNLLAKKPISSTTTILNLKPLSTEHSTTTTPRIIQTTRRPSTAKQQTSMNTTDHLTTVVTVLPTENANESNVIDLNNIGTTSKPFSIAETNSLTNYQKLNIWMNRFNSRFHPLLQTCLHSNKCKVKICKTFILSKLIQFIVILF